MALLEDALQLPWSSDVTTADLQRNLDGARAKVRKSHGQ